MGQPLLTRPTFEQHPNGFGVAHASPRISWRFLASQETVPNWAQTGYEIEITLEATAQTATYTFEGVNSMLVPWPAEPLESRQAATIRVRSFGKSSSSGTCAIPTEWSEPATVETGLLEQHDWTGSFITSIERTEKNGTIQPVQFWRSFKLPETASNPLKARLYITAHGVFDVLINGQCASDECMAPGWTSYRHRLVYRTLDIGHLLKPDAENTIRIEVGEGWFAGRLGFKGGKRFWFGDNVATLAQLEVTCDNSGPWRLVTDNTWSYGLGPIQSSGIYDGEIYDHRWESSDPASAPLCPRQVKTLPWPRTKLISSDAPPVRIIESLAPRHILQAKSGRPIVDFGQNLVGKLRVKFLSIADGAQVSFRHAEVLEDGELGTRPLRFAKCTDTVVGSGQVIRDWTPKFTFHGFRYVEVDGWPSDSLPLQDNIEAMVLHSDIRRRGFFNCSNTHVNRLHENVVWSTKGNFVSLPTDCPQRDERLGWTGDLQVFYPTASFLYDTTGFVGNWLEDVAAEQLEPDRGGVPPLVVPDVLPPNWPRVPQAIWDDVTVLTPHDVYTSSADIDVLRRQLPSMRAWLEQGIDRGSDGLWNFDRWQLGDWLDPAAPPEDPGYGRTDGVLVADAYLVHVTKTFARICRVVGQDRLAGKYELEYEVLKGHFQNKYISPAGNLMSNTQTGIALALHFGLYQNAKQIRVASAALSKLVRSARFHISTGFAGTPVIAQALTSVGQTQLAYRMLLEKTCPSWLFPVTMGATTIWERWDSMLPDGRINPGSMTSFNHYALGAIANWLHTSVGGISPLEPGWRVIQVRPVPGGNVRSAQVEFDGPYGLIKCSWVWRPEENGNFELRLTVPPNSRAVVTLPSVWMTATNKEAKELTENVGSGNHTFRDRLEIVDWPPLPVVAINQQPSEGDIAI